MRHEHASRRDNKLAATLIGGALSGIFAGFVMMVAALIHAGAAGAGLWLPLRLVATPWYGLEALVGDAAVVGVGLLTHLGVSAVFGVLFAAITSRRSTVGASLLSGAAFGAVLWLLMTWVVLPLVAPPLYEWTRLAPLWWFTLHLIFGASLLLTPALERAVGGLPAGPVEA